MRADVPAVTSPLLTLAQAAAYLRVKSVRTVQRAVRAGELRAYRPKRGSVFFLAADLDAYALRNPTRLKGQLAAVRPPRPATGAPGTPADPTWNPLTNRPMGAVGRIGRTG